MIDQKNLYGMIFIEKKSQTNKKVLKNLEQTNQSNYLTGKINAGEY
jgi:hypothetical protein